MRNNRRQKRMRELLCLNYNDAPVDVSVTQSIRELRVIYSEMSDELFSKWYQKRYFVKSEDVLHVITLDKTNGEKTLG